MGMAVKAGQMELNRKRGSKDGGGSRRVEKSKEENYIYMYPSNKQAVKGDRGGEEAV